MSKVTNISLVGVGGQGTLLASNIICEAAMQAGLDVKKNEVHGMAQRGGSVVSQVRIGEKVFSPLVPDGATDILISFEKLEALRYAHFLAPGGVCYVNNQEIVPITVATGQAKWPEDIDGELAKIPNVKVINALDEAKKLGNTKAVNIVMLGTIAANTDIDKEIWIEAIKKLVKPKFLELNLKAFEIGYASAE